MKSTGYHFRIFDHLGAVHYDSVKVRVNRYTSKEQAEYFAEKKIKAIKLIESRTSLLDPIDYTFEVYES